MLSFNSLGNLGRLANQMFQYASLKGIATNRGYDFCIPSQNIFGREDANVRMSDSNIFNTFKLKNFNYGITNYPTLQERCFEFDSDLFNQCPDNIDLQGYFQSEKYFKHIESDIREAFTFVNEISDPTLEAFHSEFGDSDVISLHVRRGDYTSNANHPVQPLEYYTKAIDLMPLEVPVMIFSDDIEWCKEQAIFFSDRFIFSEGNSTSTDLYLQSLCKYHIIANSSFSWWGSWLAKSKKTIAPRNWFAGSCINYNTDDLYCSDWIIL